MPRLWGNQVRLRLAPKKLGLYVVIEAFVCCLKDVPVAQAAPADIQDLLGGALFKALYKWMRESGPVYLLPTGHSPARWPLYQAILY